MASNQARIKGNNNNVLQNIFNNPIFVIGAAENIDLLASEGKYEAIQSLYQKQMEQIQQAHPLSDYFSVTPITVGNYHKLISTPKTAEALQKYPLSITANIKFNKADYPSIGEGETLWEYSYRIQEEIIVDAFDTKEFLGEVENPFPIMIKLNDAKMKMVPPPFPEPKRVEVFAGNCSFLAMLYRIPSYVHKEVAFSLSSNDIPLLLKLTIHEESLSAKLTISYTESTSAEQLLVCEKFLEQMRCAKKIGATSDEGILFSIPISEEDTNKELLAPKPELVKFLENLIMIEKKTGCRFNFSGSGLKWEDYIQSYVLVASLNETLHLNLIDFDKFYIDWERIQKGIDEKCSEESIMSLEYEGTEFEFYGVLFGFDKLVNLYQNARINNLNSVKKHIKRKKKKILVTIKPFNEEVGRIKNYRKFENLRILNQN